MAVYDGVGKTTFLDGLEGAGANRADDPVWRGQRPARPTPAGDARARRFAVRPATKLQTYTRTPELLKKRARGLFELIETGALDIRIGARYPLEQARQAHEDLEARKTTGKLLLIP